MDQHRAAGDTKAFCACCFSVAAIAVTIWVLTLAEAVFSWGSGWDRNYLWIAPLVVFAAIGLRCLWRGEPHQAA